METIEKKFAMAISVIFQPIFVPLYSLIILFNADTYITYAVQPEVKKFIYHSLLFENLHEEVSILTACCNILQKMGR